MASRNRSGLFLCSLAAAIGSTWAAAAPAAAFVTEFGLEVNQSIDRAIEHFRNAQSNDGSIAQHATGLAALCMLEKPENAQHGARAVGYRGLGELDQERLRRAAKWMVDSYPASGHQANYGMGNFLMALSVYLATGGPIVVDGTDIQAGVRAMVDRVQGYQGAQGCNQGGWNYSGPGNDGDTSVTQFSMAGLSAATAIFDDAGAGLIDAIAFTDNTKTDDGGHSYRGCRDGASHSMTGSGLWTYRLAGVQPQDERVQSALAWIRNRYAYAGGVSGHYYYYLWASAKGLEVSLRPRGFEGGMFSEDIGGDRDPADDGYPDELASWYYDYAYTLVDRQSDDGSWGAVHETAFACLVLERSLGGVCLEQDDDDVCDIADNCPGFFNPEQLDTDGDGIGDACDSCPNSPNRGQEDQDGDGLGDACDPYVCTATGEDVCDGIDNDCDAAIDEGIGDQAEPVDGQRFCATGAAGECAAGQSECVDGEYVCVPLAAVADEVCDLVDNDCDGLVDEQLRNDCGECGVAPTEVCNGLDDDCDGLTDEDFVGANGCDGGGRCVNGECAQPCAAGECFGDTICRGGLCVSPCNGVDCPEGFICSRREGECIDPCADIECAAGQACRNGVCGTCDTVGCPEGQACIAGACQAHPCAGVRCLPGEYCNNGECRDSCAGLSCPFQQLCIDGVCIDDACGGIQCPDEMSCDAGVCIDDPCLDVVCDPGAVCVDGACVEDPCSRTRCGAGELCDVYCAPEGQGCDPICVPGWTPDPDIQGDPAGGPGPVGGGDPGDGNGDGAGRGARPGGDGVPGDGAGAGEDGDDALGGDGRPRSGGANDGLGNTPGDRGEMPPPEVAMPADNCNCRVGAAGTATSPASVLTRWLSTLLRR